MRNNPQADVHDVVGAALPALPARISSAAFKLGVALNRVSRSGVNTFSYGVNRGDGLFYPSVVGVEVKLRFNVWAASL